MNDSGALPALLAWDRIKGNPATTPLPPELKAVV